MKRAVRRLWRYPRRHDRRCRVRPLPRRYVFQPNCRDVSRHVYAGAAGTRHRYRRHLVEQRGVPGRNAAAVEGAATSSACVPCAAGTFSTCRFAGASCTPCPAGTFLPVVGASSVDTCQQCPTGKFQPNLGAVLSSNCSACPPGTYGDAPGAACRRAGLPRGDSATPAAGSMTPARPAPPGLFHLHRANFGSHVLGPRVPTAPWPAPTHSTTASCARVKPTSRAPGATNSATV